MSLFFEFFEWYAVYNTNTFFDNESYTDWYNKVIKESFKTSKTETEYYIVFVRKSSKYLILCNL